MQIGGLTPPTETRRHWANNTTRVYQLITAAELSSRTRLATPLMSTSPCLPASEAAGRVFTPPRVWWSVSALHLCGLSQYNQPCLPQVCLFSRGKSEDVRLSLSRTGTRRPSCRSQNTGRRPLQATSAGPALVRCCWFGAILGACRSRWPRLRN